MNCQRFSTGFSSGLYGGSSSAVTQSGSLSALLLCQPARSITSTTCSPALTSAASIRRKTLKVPVSTFGASSATLSPVAGSTAA